MSESDKTIDWSKTTFEGSRREQLRRWAQLPLENILLAIEEMQDLSQQLGTASAGEYGESTRQASIKEPAVDYSADFDVELPGCTPEPLMAYLKALGILRLVSEQKDKRARGWWKNDVFWLRSTLDQAALMKFFLEDYRPTPIVAPWNAGSGFYLKWDERKGTFRSREASDAISEIESSTTSRFQLYRDQILTLKKALQSRAQLVEPGDLIKKLRENGNRQDWSKRKTDQEVKKLLDSQMFFSAAGATYAIEKVDKDKLLSDTRSSLVNDKAIDWIDTAFVIRTEQKKNRDEAPLLGSGGNIGNSDFSARFMQTLIRCLPLNDGEASSEETTVLLRGALFAQLTSGLDSIAVDQFDPGRAGGANMYQGMEASPRLNPWDYILMLEGVVVLQGASSKRLGSNLSVSAFPFAVESTPVGFESSGLDDTRGEQWLPLWNRPSTAAEIRRLLAEGRAEVSGRSVRTGVEFARAAASLGVDRGIKQFVRIQYQARFGDNYLANVIGRVGVIVRESIDLLRDIDQRLAAVRRAAGDKNVPPRFSSALRRVDSAVFDFCKYGGAAFFQEVLISLGTVERELCTTERFRNEKKLFPLAGLSSAWADAADDQSIEFAVARVLASIDDPERKIGPLRANLEPVDWKKRCREWAEKDRAVVWKATDLTANLVNVLERRMMDGARAGCDHLPLASRVAVPLALVAKFLAGELDDRRIADLIWGLMLVDDRGNRSRDRQGTDDVSVPRAYALLKLLFLSRPLVIERTADGRVFARLLRNNERRGIVIRPEPSILSLLRVGRLGEACVTAMRRLRASGLAPMPSPIRGRRMRDHDWQELDRIGDSGIDPQRLAAALLIPIRDDAVNRLVAFIVRGDDIPNDQIE
jgi:CRISPR-associated protein Csx17